MGLTQRHRHPNACFILGHEGVTRPWEDGMISLGTPGVGGGGGRPGCTGAPVALSPWSSLCSTRLTEHLLRARRRSRHCSRQGGDHSDGDSAWDPGADTAGSIASGLGRGACLWAGAHLPTPPVQPPAPALPFRRLWPLPICPTSFWLTGWFLCFSALYQKLSFLLARKTHDPVPR